MGKRKDNLDKILLNKTNETVKFKKNDFRIYKFSAHKCTELLVVASSACAQVNKIMLRFHWNALPGIHLL